MTRSDIMKFTLVTPVADVTRVMAKVRHRYFPILDEDGKYCGMVSRRNIINLQKRRIILVDHNEATQAVEWENSVYNQDESPKAFRAFGEWHQNVETKMPSHVHKPTVWSCLCPSRSVLYGQRKVHVFPARMILSKQTTAA